MARRILAAAGLTRAADLERARGAVRTAERERAARAAGAASEKLDSLAGKLRAAEDRADTEHAGHEITRGLLHHYLQRLARMESEIVERVTLERRVIRAHLAFGAASARQQSVSPADAAEAARFASLSADYQSALSRRRAGHRPDGLREVDVAGLRWSVPADRAPEAPPGQVERWLPMDEIAAIRQFVVGGVMIDIGAGAGAASIPRVVLGDVERAYAVEPDGIAYEALVANTLDNQLQGRVLPDRSSDTVDAWLNRLGVALDDVRLVRLAMLASNLDALDGAASLLSNPRIVWQIELSPSVLAAARSRLDGVTHRIGAHFTFLKELGRLGPGRLHPASEAAALFRALAEERRGVNMLLFNLPGAGSRKRSI